MPLRLFPLLLSLSLLFLSCFRHELPPPSGVSEVVVRFSDPGEVNAVEPALGFLGSQPVVFFYHGVSGELRLATPATTPEGVSWVVKRITGSREDPRGRMLRVLGDGKGFHLLYQDPLTGNLHYAYGVPGRWVFLDPLPPGDRREDPDLALDSQGVLWIAYRNATQGGVELIHPEGNTFFREIVNPSAGSGYHLRLGVDPSGRKYIVYSDMTDGTLKVSIGKARGEGWVTEVVDGTLRSGASWISLAMGAPGVTDIAEIYPRILYYDRYRRILKYAEKRDPEKPFQVEEVDPQPFRGSDNSLLLDPSGDLWISYLDGTQLDLWLGRRREKGWNLWLEEGAGAVGLRSQLAVDDRGGIHAVYLRVDTRELLYHSIRWE